MVYVDRPDRRRGGVAVLAHSCRKPSVVETGEVFYSFEYLMCKLNALNGTVRIIVVYRPPSSPCDVFRDKFEHFIKTFRFRGSPILIAGGLNINMYDPNDRQVGNAS